MREVVVITGGKSGLGGVLAEILAMRGVEVAVLDVAVTEEEEEEREEGSGTEKGMRLYKCDVGDAQALERVWGRVVKEVCTFLSVPVHSFLLLSVWSHCVRGQC